ncbi:hypothetical protein ACHAW5_004793 [Stephanodiscus triporus]|uniref:CS domain-containing protein n=1 Tax=Stephanodiscus triporus TaxID=2934178 RepID=A0ABD3MKR3_9STRA
MSKSNITNYAFVDEDARVKVYVELPGVGNCPDENISLDFTERSVCLTVKNYAPPPSAKARVDDASDELVADTTAAAPDAAEVVEEEAQRRGGGEDRCLSFGRLYAEIENATYRKKADRVIITLTKKDDTAWSAVIA